MQKKFAKSYSQSYSQKKHPGIREKPECRVAPGNKRENQVTLMRCGIDTLRHEADSLRSHICKKIEHLGCDPLLIFSFRLDAHYNCYCNRT